MSKKKPAPAAEGDTPAQGKSHKGLMIVVIVLLLVVLGGGGYIFTMHKAAAAKAAEAAPPPPVLSKTDLYLSLEPPFVVNFKDGETLRFLQVSVTLMSHDQLGLDAAKAADPVIRNALVGLFSNQDYAVISTADGRKQLQGKALESVQKIVKERLGRPGVEALYFTSFVMQ